jgi:hypothetical protein
MLKIEKLNSNVNLQKDDVVNAGKAVLTLVPAAGSDPAVTMLGHFTTSRAGTGEVAEISVAGKLASNTDISVANVGVKLTGRIKRTLKKDATTIDVSAELGAVSDTDITVLDASTLAAVTVDETDGPITGISDGVITFKTRTGDDNKDTDYLIEFTFATGAATDPDTAASHTLTIEAGDYHVHILSRLKDDVTESHMHNLTSLTFKKYIPTSVDL